MVDGKRLCMLNSIILNTVFNYYARPRNWASSEIYWVFLSTFFQVAKLLLILSGSKIIIKLLFLLLLNYYFYYY